MPGAFGVIVLLDVQSTDSDALYIEKRDGEFWPALWCWSHGAQPCPPEVLAWHDQQSARWAEKGTEDGTGTGRGDEVA